MNILFVVVVPFPFGDASSVRAFNLCKLLHLAGHNVHVISDHPSKTEVKTEISCCTYEDTTKYSSSLSLASKSIKAVKEYIANHKVDVVLMNARFDRFGRLLSLLKRRSIKVLVENCEWYDYSSFKLGRIDPRFWWNEYMIRCEFRKADGFISISELLNGHNTKWGRCSVRIPTILDVTKTSWSRMTGNNKLQLVYAGSLGKSKELLGPIIRVLSYNSEIQDKIDLHIYGPSINAVANNIGDNQLLNNLDNCVYIHGRVSQTNILDIMKKADFVLFFRPNRKSSDAGFPTKLGESMSVGTPVITNNTGDISKYVKSKENGIIVPDLSDESVLESINYILTLSSEERSSMREKARKTAETAFDYRTYVGEIEKLLKSI